MKLSEAEILRWMRDVATQEHLAIRRLLLVTPDAEPVEVQGCDPASQPKSPTAHRTELTAARHFRNVFDFLQSRETLFIRGSDGLIVVTPVGRTGRTLVAEAVGAGGTEGILGVALSSLAKFLAGEGRAPRLRRHRMN